MPILNKQGMSFDEFEQKKLEEQRETQIALEFYKSLIEEFGWEHYKVIDSWHSSPSLNVKGIACNDVEFSFGGGNLRIVFNRTIFIVPADDKYVDAIKKILEVFDYVEINNGEELKAIR